MKDYIIIDTRNLGVQIILIGHQEDRIVILEKRQYLLPCKQNIWVKKFPEIIEKIQNDYPDLEKVLLPPEAVCLNLTIEIPVDNHFTVEQKIAHVLYKNFQLYPSKMVYKYWNLDKNRYAVVLIEKKFLKFIQSYLPEKSEQSLLLFPPFVGLLNYFKNLDLTETTIAVFYEDKLRRFFIKNQSEVNFIDFYQTANTSHKVFFKDLKSTQQLISQSLNIEGKKKKIILFGDIPEELKEIYEQEHQNDVKIVKSLEQISGFLENVSVMRQCLYIGIDQLVQAKDAPLNIFNFSSFLPSISIWGQLNQKIKKHKKSISFFLWLWFGFSALAFVYAYYESGIVKKRFVAFNELQEKINTLKRYNEEWENQNKVRCFIPQIFLHYYEILKTLPGKFCIDGLGINSEKDKTFCCIKGRIYEKDLSIFEENLSKKLKVDYKISLKSAIKGKKQLNYRIKIPIKIPQGLQ